MKDRNNNDTKLTEYIGISAPETPKYIILVNFLERYFKINNENFLYDSIIKWENNKIITEEGDDLVKENLMKSFNAYINAYIGLDATNTINKKNKRYFPIIPNMITSSKQYPLRHLLYTLQISQIEENKRKQVYKDMQNKIYEYLYPDMEKNTDIYRILKYICGGQSYIEDIRRIDPPDNLFGLQSKEKYFCDLSNLFNYQLNKILMNRYLMKLDIYRRLEFLSTFLGLFVLQYILERTNSLFSSKKDANIIICKGSTNLDITNDAIHRASQNCYVNIRAQFPEMIKSYYKQQIDEIDSENIKFSLLDKEKDEIKVEFDNHTELNLLEFLKKYNLSVSTRMQNKLLQKFEDTFFVNGKQQIYNKEDFAMEYYNLQKSIQGSSVAKISSSLPTTGRDINILFPKSNARQKYFAMSSEIVEFFVRLYLAEINNIFGYYDDFVEWIQQKFKIYIRLDSEGILNKYLHKISSSISVQDSNKNEQAFIKTLFDANCLIKLSDSGFIIVLPEKKGEITLI